MRCRSIYSGASLLPGLFLLLGCAGASSSSSSPSATPVAAFSFAPAAPAVNQAVAFQDASSHTPTAWAWNFGDGTTSTAQNPSHTYASAGTFTVTLSASTGAKTSSPVPQTVTVASTPATLAYPLVGTLETLFYNNSTVMTLAPAAASAPFFGQDAQYPGPAPAYQNNGDGTVTDLNTGLMWVQARGSEVSLSAALAGAARCTVGGHSDWRVPNIKELYSLIEFSGAAGTSMTSTAGYIPFLDSVVFGFCYGPGTSTTTGDRVIDCQDWSGTPYVSTTMGDAATEFGVNFADGHLKGYPIYQPGTTTVDEVNYIRYVRGNPSYSINTLVNNGDGTLTDTATGLMWAQNDSGSGMDWQAALAWIQSLNQAAHLGHSDWRLPNAKELQSLVDYSRSPDTTHSAAIDPLFNCTGIINEGGQPDFPYYWTGTTLDDNSPAYSGVYVAFGRALGWMPVHGASYLQLLDVHGAGAQRSDPKSGAVTSYQLGTDASGQPAYGRGPQGDVVRITNFVRPVRVVQ